MLLLALSAGIVFSSFVPTHWSWLVAPPLCAGFYLLCSGFTGRGFCLCLFCFFLGVNLAQLAMGPPRHPSHVAYRIDAEPVRLEGRVLSVARGASGRWTLDLAAQRYWEQGGGFRPATGKLRLYVESQDLPVVPGQRLLFQQKLRAPSLYGTPGEFDFPRHLAREEIWATAFLRGADALVPLVDAFVARGGLIESLRHRLAREMDSTLGDSAPRVRALVLGDKAGLTPGQRKLFAATGLAHLFSISGFHFALVGALLYALGGQLYRRFDVLLLWQPPRRLLLLAVLPLLVCYFYFTGGATPALRALLVAGALAFLLLLRRKARPLDVLALAAFLILLFDPLALFTAAFQLSFAGVAGILLACPRWQLRLRGRPGWIAYPANLMLVTLAATLATTPVLIWHFHFFAPAGLLTNLFAMPLVGFVAVPLGLCGAVFHGIWADFSLLLWQGCALSLELVLRLARWSLRLPGMSGASLYLPPAAILGLGQACLSLLWLPAERPRRKRLGLLAAAAALLVSSLLPGDELRVTALSVGQGDATLVSLGQTHILVDGGGLYSDHFDVGERLVAPALARLGVRRLDVLVLTHDHPDHAKGIPAVLEAYRPETFYAPVSLPELNETLRERLAALRVKSRVPPAGWSRILENETGEAYLWRNPDAQNTNDGSLALYVRAGEGGVLLTGDLEGQGARALLAAELPGPVGLLKLPHHGSAYSGPERMIEALGPRQVFVSAGRQNRFGHPSTDAVRSAEQCCGKLWRTDADGTLMFRATDSGWRPGRWERGLFR